jgi:hypothetical protein
LSEHRKHVLAVRTKPLAETHCAKQELRELRPPAQEILLPQGLSSIFANVRESSRRFAKAAVSPRVTTWMGKFGSVNGHPPDDAAHHKPTSAEPTIPVANAPLWAKSVTGAVARSGRPQGS